MKIRHLAAALLALTLPFAATACGADSTGDLSEKEISEQLQKGGLPAETADCIAGDLKDANLTEEQLEEFNKSQDTSSETGKVLMKAVTACMTAE